ncbi:MAG: hypothetical protein LQ351_006465 [Letrouitia transgressa]|nr:MAG: hypothetical protein LQ351_006465 [Letrouitia transgressa]
MGHFSCLHLSILVSLFCVIASCLPAQDEAPYKPQRDDTPVEYPPGFWSRHKCPPIDAPNPWQNTTTGESLGREKPLVPISVRSKAESAEFSNSTLAQEQAEAGNRAKEVCREIARIKATGSRNIRQAPALTFFANRLYYLSWYTEQRIARMGLYYSKSPGAVTPPSMYKDIEEAHHTLFGLTMVAFRQDMSVLLDVDFDGTVTDGEIVCFEVHEQTQP